MQELILRILPSVAAERTRLATGILRDRHQRTHPDADQLRRTNADEVGHAPIHAQYVIVMVVDNDEIRDRVEDLDPLIVRLRYAHEQSRIVERNRRMSRECLQYIAIDGFKSCF